MGRILRGDCTKGTGTSADATLTGVLLAKLGQERHDAAAAFREAWQPHAPYLRVENGKRLIGTAMVKGLCEVRGVCYKGFL